MYNYVVEMGVVMVVKIILIVKLRVLEDKFKLVLVIVNEVWF